MLPNLHVLACSCVSSDGRSVRIWSLQPRRGCMGLRYLNPRLWPSSFHYNGILEVDYSVKMTFLLAESLGSTWHALTRDRTRVAECLSPCFSPSLSLSWSNHGSVMREPSQWLCLILITHPRLHSSHLGWFRFLFSWYLKMGIKLQHMKFTGQSVSILWWKPTPSFLSESSY